MLSFPSSVVRDSTQQTEVNLESDVAEFYFALDQETTFPAALAPHLVPGAGNARDQQPEQLPKGCRVRILQTPRQVAQGGRYCVRFLVEVLGVGVASRVLEGLLGGLAFLAHGRQLFDQLGGVCQANGLNQPADLLLQVRQPRRQSAGVRLAGLGCRPQLPLDLADQLGTTGAKELGLKGLDEPAGHAAGIDGELSAGGGVSVSICAVAAA
jgi:hypothetical protein